MYADDTIFFVHGRFKDAVGAKLIQTMLFHNFVAGVLFTAKSF